MTLPFAVLWASLATGLTILLLFLTHSLRPGASTDLVTGLGSTAAAYLLCVFLIARTHAGQQNLADLLGVRKTHPLLYLLGAAVGVCLQIPAEIVRRAIERRWPTPPDIILDQIEDRTRRIGRWLGGYGYRGTFGVDFLVKDGQVLFTEVNPRFQGSSAASSRLSVEAGQPCLLLEHVAANLGVSVQRRPPLRTQVREARPLAQVVVHSKGSRPAHLDISMLADSLRAVEAGVQAEALAPASVQVEPSAVVGRFVARRRLTWSGYDLDTGWERVIDGWQTSQGARKEGKN